MPALIRSLFVGTSMTSLLRYPLAVLPLVLSGCTLDQVLSEMQRMSIRRRSRPAPVPREYLYIRLLDWETKAPITQRADGPHRTDEEPSDDSSPSLDPKTKEDAPDFTARMHVYHRDNGHLELYETIEIKKKQLEWVLEIPAFEGRIAAVNGNGTPKYTKERYYGELAYLLEVSVQGYKPAAVMHSPSWESLPESIELRPLKD